MENSNSPIIKAAGGILWRDDNSDKEKRILVVHRPEYDDWSLPKGKLEEIKNESWKAAALREVFEETGCVGAVEKAAGTVSYFTNDTPKIVVYWIMKLVSEEIFRPNEEVDRIRWVSLSEGTEWLSYENEKNLLAEAFA